MPKFFMEDGDEVEVSERMGKKLLSEYPNNLSIAKVELPKIEKETGKKPLVIATSAKHHEDISTITYHDQELVWKEGRPVLFLLGTAFGLSEPLVKRCDYVLKPIEGFVEFNHLSVRSAAAIIFDRWLGINIKRHGGAS